jgi:hypothetical protein
MVDRPPSDLVVEKKEARLGNDQSQPKPCSAPGHAQIQRLSGWRSPLLIVFFCILASVLSGCSSYVVNSAASGTLVATPETVAFGTVSVGQSASTPVSLTNGGAAPIQITQIDMAGQSFAIDQANEMPVTVTPGGSYNLLVRFNPSAGGTASGQVTITSNAALRPTTVVQLSGSGISTSTPTPSIASLSCIIGSMTGSGSDGCTVTLSNAASSGGFVVSLASSNAAVALPTTLTVPAGANTAGFTAAISSVGTAQTATLTATADNASKTFTMQLNAAVPTLSVNATNVGFGNVEVNSGATQSVVLTSTGTAPVTISAATVTGAGFTLAPVTFPLTLTSGETATLEVSFDPKFAGSANGQVTITNNSSTGNTAVIPLSGTGTPPLVELSWNAPSDATDPIAGYNVYRAPAGTIGFQMLNSSAVPETTYTDATVRSGQTYDYIVESVDQDGVESIPSNLISLTVP